MLNELGLVRKHQDQYGDAERMLRRSLEIREKAFGREHYTVAQAHFDLASILALRGKNDEAETAYRDSLALREKLHASGKGVDAGTVALTMNGLGLHLARTGRLAEAEARIRRSLEIRRAAGSAGYAYALSLLDLGRVVAQQNRWAEAERLTREGRAALEGFVERGDGRLEEADAQLAKILRQGEW